MWQILEIVTEELLREMEGGEYDVFVFLVDLQIVF